ncbi:MAG: hypothetical protein ACMXYG_00030 [Candidatus Woesearchaeota archaeon]
MWTDEDKKRYIPRDYEPLVNLYKEHKLPIYKPEERAKFLTEQVLSLREVDIKLVKTVDKEMGKGAVLNLLEDMVVTLHEEAINAVKTKIPMPLKAAK